MSNHLTISSNIQVRTIKHANVMRSICGPNVAIDVEKESNVTIIDKKETVGCKLQVATHAHTHTNTVGNHGDGGGKTEGLPQKRMSCKMLNLLSRGGMWLPAPHLSFFPLDADDDPAAAACCCGAGDYCCSLGSN